MTIRELRFGNIVRTADVRMLHDMDEVIYDKKWLEGVGDLEMYYMFRDLYKNDSDHGIIKANHLRYDITIIPPNMLGNEYVKTVGHFHPEVPGTNITYPELYQVLEGHATYLLQRMEGGRVMDLVEVKAGPGDCVIIPPGYGHVTINNSDEVLKMANWVCSDFSSIYGPIKELGGEECYLLKTGFVKNPHYHQVPHLRSMKPMKASELGLKDGEEIYGLINDIDRLRFLTTPQKFGELFKKVIGQ